MMPWKPGRSALRLSSTRTPSCSRQTYPRYRHLATASTDIDASKPIGGDETASPKIASLVDQISGLSLIEAADLVGALKKRLNISEVTAIAAPAASQGSAAATATTEEQPAEEAAAKKTIFNVTLQSFDPAVKAKIIKEVKAQIAGLNLVEAKKFAESVPKVIREGCNKEDAEKLKTLFEGLGAKITLE